MIVFVNGAPKSGTTWIFNLISEMGRWDSVPREFLDSDWKHPSILKNKLGAFLRHSQSADANYLVKTHLPPKQFRDPLLSVPEVYVVHSERDVRDSLVSMFHHDLRLEGKDFSFLPWYRARGRFYLLAITRYNHGWKNPEHPRVLCTSFEELKEQPIQVLTRLDSALGFGHTREELEAINKKCSLKTLREKYDGQAELPNAQARSHFREGKVGGWRDTIPEDELQEIDQLAHDRLNPTVRLKFALLRRFYRVFPFP